jgi:hypothetical protein
LADELPGDAVGDAEAQERGGDVGVDDDKAHARPARREVLVLERAAGVAGTGPTGAHVAAAVQAGVEAFQQLGIEAWRPRGGRRSAGCRAGTTG